jgi:hypothetical protein
MSERYSYRIHGRQSVQFCVRLHRRPSKVRFYVRRVFAPYTVLEWSTTS